MTDAFPIDVTALRTSLDWSQKRLGRLLGCSPATICRFEGGKARGPLKLLVARLDRLAKRHVLAGMSDAEVVDLIVGRDASDAVPPHPVSHQPSPASA